MLEHAGYARNQRKSKNTRLKYTDSVDNSGNKKKVNTATSHNQNTKLGSIIV